MLIRLTVTIFPPDVQMWRRRHFRKRRPAYRRRRHTRRSRHHRRHRRKHYRYFWLKLSRTYTVMWPAATKPTTDPNEADETRLLHNQNTKDPGKQTFGWNLDHVHIVLDDFLPPKTTLYFQDYRIRLAALKVREVNTVYGQREETYGHHALDLDGMDEGGGTVSRWSGDPNVPSPSNANNGPFVSDPLVNRSSGRLWNTRRGFKRLFRPMFQVSGAAKNQGAASTFWNRSNHSAWLPCSSSGITIPHQGVSISLRETDTPIVTQYFISIYVQFREFDLKSNKF
uniref:Capsid protein n=1 Tax=Barbastella barbastellus feces associated circovirus 2 TaxID=3139968 RepID=A0AAU6S525_9CIRC